MQIIVGFSVLAPRGDRTPIELFFHGIALMEPCNYRLVLAA
jgi:hypothetical protein